VSNIAHGTIAKGRYSELLAQTALLANGWTVAEPITPEPYDIIARNPKNGRWVSFQVKTARIRDDRKGEIVVYAKKNNGKAYTLEETDFFIGVLGQDVYMFKNRGIGEYWVKPNMVERKWRKLTTELM
jgi:hypothetical protein